MLRMYLVQVWFHLSDEGCEDAVLDSRAIQRFVGVDMMAEQVPDATTLLKFRRLVEENGLGERMFSELGALLERAGVMMRGGSIVGAAFVEAPSSTKNRRGGRDPEAHQAKKGNNWHFGYKAHVGADAGSGLVHTVSVTPANTSDVSMAHALVREDDRVCYGDSGHTGAQRREEVASDPALSGIEWRVARRPSSISALLGGTGRQRARDREAQGERARQGRAPVPRRQAPVRLGEDPLQGGSRRTQTRCSWPSRPPTSRCSPAPAAHSTRPGRRGPEGPRRESCAPDPPEPPTGTPGERSEAVLRGVRPVRIKDDLINQCFPRRSAIRPS